jgi:uncharacterized membrane protein YgcG
MSRSNPFSLLMLSDSFGLNKLARLLRERELLGDEEDLPLESPFPYEVLGFDDKFFGAEPSDVEEEATRTNSSSGGGFAGGGGQFGGGGASGSF